MARPRVPEAPQPAVTTVITKTQTIEGQAPPLEPISKPERVSLDQFIRGLKIEEVNDYSFYLYRLDEGVGTREGPKYLTRLEPQDLNQIDLADFTESLKNFMLTKANKGRGFGGGQFNLKVNYRKTGDNLYNENFRIEGAPVLTDREVLLAPVPGTLPASGAPPEDAIRNVAVDFLKQQMEEIRSRAIDPAVAVQKVMEMMQKANDKALEIALKQVPQAADPMTQLASILTALKTMGIIGQPPAPANPDQGIVHTITTLKELGLIQLPGQGEKRSALADLKESLEALKTLRESGFFGESAGGASPWLTIVPQALEKIPVIFDKLREVSLARAATMGAPSMPPLGPPRSVAPGSPAIQTVPAPASPSQPGATTPIAPSSPAPMDPGVFIRLKLVEFFQRGVGGDRVAEWLDMADPPTAAQLSVLPAPVIIEQVINKDEILKQMTGHPALPKFIEDFLSYWKEEEGEQKPVPPVPVH